MRTCTHTYPLRVRHCPRKPMPNVCFTHHNIGIRCPTNICALQTATSDDVHRDAFPPTRYIQIVGVTLLSYCVVLPAPVLRPFFLNSNLCHLPRIISVSDNNFHAVIGCSKKENHVFGRTADPSLVDVLMIPDGSLWTRLTVLDCLRSKLNQCFSRLNPLRNIWTNHQQQCTLDGPQATNTKTGNFVSLTSCLFLEKLEKSFITWRQIEKQKYVYMYCGYGQVLGWTAQTQTQ